MGGQFHPQQKTKRTQNLRPSKEKYVKTHIFKSPSFIYRQDGYELSYEIVAVFYHAPVILSSPLPRSRKFSIAFSRIFLYNTSVIRV